MISIENFYLILYQHLLAPLDYMAVYAYPFGTRDHVCYLRKPEQVLSPIALFHHDQEPLYHGDEAWILQNTGANYLPRLLANSEISDLKNRICHDHQLLDWYYFYHGFAALDWYRDARYVVDDWKILKPFLTFNHLVSHRRAYRMALIARLFDLGLADHGIISFHATGDDCLAEIENPDSLLTAESRHLIRRHLVDKIDLPITADQTKIGGSASANFAHETLRTRQQALFTIVNETVFFDAKLHLTEKIFQPIVCSRPFILAAAPGNLAYLKSYGFETFGDFIDESYDSIIDADQRMEHIANIVADICSRPIHELERLLADMRPILEHNKRHFFGKFREILVDELLQNFNRCIDTWNGWKVTNKVYHVHENIVGVKRILLS